MGADSPTSISAIVAAKQLEFVSVREALVKLSAHSGESLAEIARGLKFFEINEVGLACLVGNERKVQEVGNPAFVTILLDLTMASGVIPDSTHTEHGAEANSDVDGWFRWPFIENLIDFGISVPESLSRPSQEPAGLAPRTTLVHDQEPTEIASLKATIASLTAERDALREENAELRSKELPRAEYLLPIVAAVQRQFWIDWKAPQKLPKQDIIRLWIEENYPHVEKRKREAIELVACPIDRNRASKKLP